MVKCWFVYWQKYFYVIVFFSLSTGCVFRTRFADRWTFVRGCCLGGSAATSGVITGTLLMWKFWRSCSSPQQNPKVFDQYWKKAFGVICGGLVGSGVGFMRSDQTAVILLQCTGYSRYYTA